MATQQVYARVINDNIVEYPVLESYIAARGDPVSFYTPVQYSTKPVISQYQYLQENATITAGIVTVNYTVLDLSLEILLGTAWNVQSNVLTMPMPGQTLPTPPLFSALAPDLIKAIEDSLIVRVQAKLDSFAQQKNYYGMGSLAGYASSSIPAFNEEAIIGIHLRDNTWMALYGLLAKMTADAVPMIKSFLDIDNLLPIMSWTPVISGSITVAAASTTAYIIENYDSVITYTVAVVPNDTGTVTVSGNTITYKAGSVAGIFGFTINGITTSVTVA